MFCLSSPQTLSNIPKDPSDEDLAQCISTNKTMNTILIKSVINKKVTILSKSLTEFNKEKQYQDIITKVTQLPDFDVFDLFHGLYQTIRPKYDLDFNIDPLLDFIKQAICADDDETYDQLLDYIAHIFQCPEEKPEYAIILFGPEGTGKGIFTKIIRRCLKPYSHKTGDNKEFIRYLKDLNSTCKLLIVITEFSKLNAKETTTFKLFTTEKQSNIPLRPGTNPISVRNYYRLIYQTNEMDNIKFSQHDRRYFVISTILLSKDYYEGFMSYYLSNKDQICSAFIDMMLRRDLSQFNPHKPPQTSIKKELISRSISKGDRNIIDFIKAEFTWLSEPRISTEVFEKYFHYCKERNIKETRNPSDLSPIFRLYCEAKDQKIKGSKKVVFRLAHKMIDE